MKQSFARGVLVPAAAVGVAFYMCWIGIEMFPYMDAPTKVLNVLYRDGAIASVVVGIISTPFLYRFWKRHGRGLSMEDFNPFVI